MFSDRGDFVPKKILAGRCSFGSSSSDVMAARSTERTVRDDTVIVVSVEFDYIDRRPPHIPSAETLFTSMAGALLIPAIWLLGELVWV